MYQCISATTAIAKRKAEAISPKESGCTMCSGSIHTPIYSSTLIVSFLDLVHSLRLAALIYLK